jgi:REP element-mobilizing transposase RayT
MTKEHLKYPAVTLDQDQIESVAKGFAELVEKSAYQVHACSIMPQHVHLVLGRYRYQAETMARLLKAQASQRLREDGRHPMAQWPKEDGSLPKPWAESCWKVFLNSDEAVARAIKYVENNPIKDGKAAQQWPFVTPFSPASQGEQRPIANVNAARHSARPPLRGGAKRR